MGCPCVIGQYVEKDDVVGVEVDMFDSVVRLLQFECCVFVNVVRSCWFI